MLTDLACRVRRDFSRTPKNFFGCWSAIPGRIDFILTVHQGSPGVKVGVRRDAVVDLEILQIPSSITFTKMVPRPVTCDLSPDTCPLSPALRCYLLSNEPTARQTAPGIVLSAS